jgi:epoxyqueuosine reductase
MDPRFRGDDIKVKALSLGFCAIGFAPATLAPEAGERLKQFVAERKHGDMGWLGERMHERSSPHHLWPEAKTVISLGYNYGPDHDPMENLAHRDKGNISVYARGRDYHEVVKKQLRVLASWIAKEFATEVKLFVDTAPVMEKPIAQQAGLGWQGKHTNLVSREYGSWLFLGEVFTSLELTPTAPETDHCGTCQKCIDICPTQAITAPYQLDARRCLSYLSIEHQGPIPHEFRKAMGNRIYGCDDCLAVCPWNKYAQRHSTPEFNRAENDLPPLAELLKLDEAAFRARFTTSPIKRIGRNRFIRNVLIAAGNSGDAKLRPHIVPLLGDADPVVQEAAIWADNELKNL